MKVTPKVTPRWSPKVVTQGCDPAGISPLAIYFLCSEIILYVDEGVVFFPDESGCDC